MKTLTDNTLLIWELTGFLGGFALILIGHPVAGFTCQAIAVALLIHPPLTHHP